MSIGIGGLSGGIAASVGGLLDASNRLAQSAQRTAGASLTPENPEVAQPKANDAVDLVGERVNQLAASYDFKANLKAFNVQDKLQKEAIDILA